MATNSGLQFAPLTRSRGHSAVATIAYNARQNIRDLSTGRLHYHHARVADHIETRIILPDGADERLQTIAGFANALEATNDIRLGFRLRLDYPKGVSHEMHREMAETFIKQHFTAQGLPAIISDHCGSRDNPDNPHAHIIVFGRSFVNGNLAAKSRTAYVDEAGNEIQMVDSPALTRKGQLKFNPNGTIKMKKGYQRLLLDVDGNPYLGSDGRIATADIRVPIIDPATGKQAMEKNGKYMKPKWKRDFIPMHDLDTLGTPLRLRMAWQDCQNEVLRKHGIQRSVDLRSLREKERDLPSWLRSIPTVKVGYDRRFVAQRRQRNANITKHNRYMKPLQKLYRSASEAAKERIHRLITSASGYADIRQAVLSVTRKEQTKAQVQVKDKTETVTVATAETRVTTATETKVEAIDKTERIRQAVLERMVAAILERHPDMNPVQVRKDLDSNRASFRSVLPLVTDTPEGRAWVAVAPKLKRTFRPQERRQAHAIRPDGDDRVPH